MRVSFHGEEHILEGVGSKVCGRGGRGLAEWERSRKEVEERGTRRYCSPITLSYHDTAMFKTMESAYWQMNLK